MSPKTNTLDQRYISSGDQATALNYQKMYQNPQSPNSNAQTQPPKSRNAINKDGLCITNLESPHKGFAEALLVVVWSAQFPATFCSDHSKVHCLQKAMKRSIAWVVLGEGNIFLRTVDVLCRIQVVRLVRRSLLQQYYRLEHYRRKSEPHALG